MTKKISVAIDGPAGSGKSTVAKQVAERLGLIYIDTGAMYRTVAWKSLQDGISRDDESGLIQVSHNVKIRFERGETVQRVFAGDVDVTEAIRTPEISSLSSAVSAIPGVRTNMVHLQQKMGSEGGVVMEGRDIGTVVLPHAEVKIFLTASPEVRAKRRYLELQGKGFGADYPQILAEINERDTRDSSRAVGPLCQAADAVKVDTDSLSIEEVISRILEIAEQRGAEHAV